MYCTFLSRLVRRPFVFQFRDPVEQSDDVVKGPRRNVKGWVADRDDSCAPSVAVCEELSLVVGWWSGTDVLIAGWCTVWSEIVSGWASPVKIF